MKYDVFCLVSALTMLATVASVACAEDLQISRENIIANITSSFRENVTLSNAGIASNETWNATGMSKVLRAGGRSARSSKALGWNGSSQKVGTEIGLEPKAEFNLSQRKGSVSKFKLNSDIYRPLFSQNQYTRTKPIYMAPDNLSSREVYNLTGYPEIMLPNAIP